MSDDRSSGKKRKRGASERRAGATHSTFDHFSIATLGAPAGTVIRGTEPADKAALRLSDDAPGNVRGVELLVVQGFCPAVSGKGGREEALRAAKAIAREGETGADAWARLLAARLGVGCHLALSMVGEAEEQQGPAARVLGTTSHTPTAAPPWNPTGVPEGECRFKILSLGAWTRRDADGVAIATQLQTWATDGTHVSGEELFLALKSVQADFDGTGPGQWCLMSNKWVRGGCSGAAPDDGRAADVDVVAILLRPHPAGRHAAHYNLDTGTGTPWRVTLPASRDEGPIPLDAAYTRFLCGRIASIARVPAAEAAAAVAFFSLPTMTAGPLKSALQKLVRVHTERVVLPSGASVCCRAAAMAALGVCFSDRGNAFVPDLGLFVVGPTAALKRLAVVMFEDAWPDADADADDANADADASPSELAAALLACATATVRLSGWHPPLELVGRCLRVIDRCVRAKRVVAWRAHPPASNAVALHRLSAPHLKHAADMLRSLRSFGGDMDMVDRCAGVSRVARGKSAQNVGQNWHTPTTSALLP